VATVFPRTTSPSWLCLILALCVAWLAPFEGSSISAGSSIATRSEKDPNRALYPRLLARTLDQGLHRTFDRSVHEFDDAEDTDDLSTLRRSSPGICDWSPRASWKPTFLVLDFRPSIARNPSPTLPRIIAFRC